MAMGVNRWPARTPFFLLVATLILALVNVIEPGPASTIVLWLLAIVSNLFVPVYAVIAPWKETDGGKLLLGMVGAIALVLDFLIASLYWGREFLGRDYFRLIAYGSLLAMMTWAIIILFQVQHAGGKRVLRHRDDALSLDPQPSEISETDSR